MYGDGRRQWPGGAMVVVGVVGVVIVLVVVGRVVLVDGR
jgi:hypothetical protein